MPASNPGSQNTNQVKPRKVKVTAKAAPPRQADQGSGARAHKVQETGKVRMYAHPQRPAAQKVFRQQAKDDATAQRQAKADKRQIARMKVTPVASPDATDSLRSPAQLAHDAAVVAKNVKDSRLKVVRREGRGSGARAVKRVLADIAKADLTNTANTGAGPTVHVVSRGHGGGMGFAAIEPVSRNLKVDDTTAAGSFIRNAASDAGNLLVTTPSSVAHLAGEQAGAAKALATRHPKEAAEKQLKVGKELAQPYVDFAKRPVHSFTEHPVSTTLMVAPIVRVPGRVAGKVARATGKQTLARPAATLPGTTLQQARIGSRDFFVRKHQAKEDAQNPNPTMTDKEVQRRVDEHYDASKQESHRTVSAAVKAAKNATKGQPKPVRAAATDAAREHAQEVARGEAEVRFAKEFGTVHQVTPEGNVVVPKGATEGALHDTYAIARKVSGRINKRGPATVVVKRAGDKYVVVPKVAAQRLYGSNGKGPMGHLNVGSSKATGAKVMRVSRGAFTGAVLPLSFKKLAGDVVESGIRSVVAGAGPMDWLRMGKVVNELNKKSPGAGDALATRVSGGQFGLTGPARDFANGKSLAEEFEGGPLAKPAGVASAVGRTAPARLVKDGWGKYTRGVLGSINHVIESNARRAMAGHAIKDLGFQDLHLNGLSEKAVEDAVNGLRGTHNQVALARAVDRMYGKYTKFSPEMRSLMLHWTPFLPWYLNTAQFLFKVLPHDHPVKTSLLASANLATEDRRKEHGLSLGAPHVPGFMLGSAPTKDGKYRGIAHYTPWGIGADPVGAVGELALPQVLGPIKNMGGVDWKWQRLTHGGKHGKEFNWPEKLVRAGVTAAEEQIPGVSQLGKISGLTPRYIDKDNPEDVKSAGEVLKGYLPWTPMSGSTSAPTSSTTSTPVRVKVPGSGSSARIKIPGVGSGRIKIP